MNQILTVTEWKPRNKPVDIDYSVEELTAAFNRVANKKDWKNAINRIVDINNDAERALINKAVIFFTGCCCDFIDLPNGKTRVIAAGYRATIKC